MYVFGGSRCFARISSTISAQCEEEWLSSRSFTFADMHPLDHAFRSCLAAQALSQNGYGIP